VAANSRPSGIIIIIAEIVDLILYTQTSDRKVDITLTYTGGLGLWS
jgi:hypothetical protein